MKDSFEVDMLKGKITEVIFELMFKEAKEFDVLPLGYERTTPILAQYQHDLQVKRVLDNIRHSPDFALISQDNKNVFLVEVKYRNEINKYIVKTAREIQEKWDPCWLFVANPEGFYFEPVSAIVKDGSLKTKMSKKWVSEDLQVKYLSLLNKYIKE